MKDKLLSIVIVTWNSEDDIAECLGSIYNTFYDPGKLKIETIVIDNNSSDNSVQVIENFIKVFPHPVRLIKNNNNLGFTKGCNQGFHIAQGDAVMLLNPDTQVIDNALWILYDKLFSSDKLGAVAPQLNTRNRNVQYTCRKLPRYSDLFYELTMLSSLFPKNKFFSRWKMKYFLHDREMEVEQPMAAALLIKKTVIDEIKGIDERFYMFFNDIDLCKQIHDKGIKILFYPEATIYHNIGTSILKDRVRMISVWNKDCLSYFRKYGYNPIAHFFLFLGLKITGFIRIIFTKIIYG